MINPPIHGGRLLLSILGLSLLFLAGEGFAASLSIKEAKWESGDRILVVKGKGPGRARVTISNAGDKSALGSTRSKRGEGEWKLKKRLETPPCQVLAEANGESAVRPVKNAGSNCDSGTVPPPAENQAPTANAGPDQTLTLASGRNSVAVTLNGSGSSDSDGMIETYNWTGSPNPADTVSPTVNLSAGSYTFTLVVTDDDGASSAPDTVAITVNAATPPPVENQAPTANAGPDQTVTLASGQSSIAVTLNGSGSSDPDGTINTYNWTGSPNPANTASPTVNLSAGSYSYDLVVTDNDGASSGSDTVLITVNAASPPPPAENQAPTANAGPDQTLTLASGQNSIAVILNGSGSSDSDGNINTYDWTGSPNPADAASPTVNLSAGSHTFTLVVTDNDSASSAADTVVITVNDAVAANCVPADLNLSINSTAQDGCPEGTVPEQPQVSNSNYSVLAINDLGMHCGDLDTRIASILPPFQVLLAQVVQKGGTPTLNPSNVTVYYSAVSHREFDMGPDDLGDPILASDVFDGVMSNGDTFKTNFWNSPVVAGTYDPFYPAYNPFNPAQTLTPLAGPPFNVDPDVGLPVPNVEDLYIGPDGVIGSGDESLTAVMHAMPGIVGPYSLNDPKHAEEHYVDKPFFINFPFGYVAEDVNWYEGAGVPFAAFDDNGRENAYPLVRVQAKSGNTVLSTVDTVLPISGEASCSNCHSDPADVQESRTSDPTDALLAVDLPVVTSLDDPDASLPNRVSVEYASDINTLRLHDLKHGANYVTPSAADDGTAVADPCTIDAANPNGSPSCLTNKALVQGTPVVCQVCHYTPALDLAQLGPLAGPVGSIANGRNQLAHSSNSNVMHEHHGETGLFPAIPPAVQLADGTIENQAARLDALEQNCYQCHPGKNTQCLRGAMFNGGMLCSDCHGDMAQVGADFSANVSPTNPGAFVLDQGNFYDPDSNQPRVPWANEPGCGSCHTGDANDNLVDESGTMVNTVDTYDNVDGIRLRQAFKTGDAKATPIVPSNKRFAEPAVPASFNGFDNPGAGNPQLYRVSTGHGGVMCEGCHGATHAEWPNANPNANDNVTAKQLQGHTGTISDCTTCHVTSQLPDDTQGGPHGMHLVDDRRFWKEGHKDAAKDENGKPGGGTCGACHGSDHLGTVLSRTPVDRSWQVEGENRQVAAGEPVGCNHCHSLSKSFGD